MELFVEQDSDAWHQERRKRVGSSEVPAIMGMSPWMTKRELAELKLGLREPQKTNYAMQRGKDLEKIAREYYRTEKDINFEPKVFQHPKFDFWMASLDGYAEIGGSKIVWECKALGEENHYDTPNGVPLKYLHQVQSQLAVTGADCVVYSTILETDHGEFEYDGRRYNIQEITVQPDREIFLLMEASVLEFWDYVKAGELPPMTDKDWQLDKNEVHLELAKKYEQFKAQKEAAERQMDMIKEAITSELTHPKVVCGNLKFNKMTTRGTVKYSLIPELKNVNLDQYRGEPKEYWKINVRG